ncbi:gp53-like domain-containing protein [Desulfocurvibacter africanus]|uniref:Sulfatase-modifying factor enzyme domain-containing protein n=1 Tax=Desulfocurvibacter africanus subsp. africanus str. Walvis Bay TaxID=690850 RepID=F3YY48_DESAF|nr:phage tail protein [Desulfocurvibacter africanus]EGJ51824.1 hypothetical protein Desaf_3543 [Desulfocurvibacter africanus subsp. africanus str. Walvis Bay]
MANFNGLVLTTAGANLQDKIAVRGIALQFMRAAVGDGVWPQGTDPAALTELVSERQSLPIQGLADTGDGQHRISLQMTNDGLSEGFLVREIGVFAQDPDQGEILYQVAYAEQPDYLPPDGGATHIEMATNLLVATSSAASVTAVMDGSLVFAHVTDLAEHADTFRGFAFSGRHEQYTGDLDAITRNSLYAVEKGVATHLPVDMPAGVQGFVQTMVQPDGESRTQTLWSVDDADHPGWWRRRANEEWGAWQVVGAAMGLPVGTVVWVPGTTPPPGMLAVNAGDILGRATWPELWEFAQNSGLLVTDTEWQAEASVHSSVGYFSDGDGATTFRLPKLVDYVRGADPNNGRPVGLWQADALQGHGHTNSSVSIASSGGTGECLGTNSSPSSATSTGRITAPVAYSSYGTPRIDIETRPKSINWLPCIQAASLPVNSGTVDMLALASEVARLGSGSGEGGISSGLPVGTMTWVPGTKPLPGMLAINDGASVSRTTWPQLWEYVQTSGLMLSEAEWQAQAAAQSSVGYFSDGDGSTTFRLPRLRDYLRGADPSSGRGVGAWQGDEFKRHAHSSVSTSLVPGTGSFSAMASYGSNSPVTTAETGGDETRPKSINWLPCIQAASVPVYSGTVDMLSLAGEVAGKVDRVEFTQSFGASGWQRLPSGLILQWGYASTSSATSGTMVFPIEFPNGCLFVAPIELVSGPQVNTVYTGIPTVTGFHWYGTNTSTGAAVALSIWNWMALGY